MPRQPRFCPAGYPAHVIHRGNNRQIIFTDDADTAAYAHWLAQGAAKYGVSVHAWVFMTNHVHLLLTPSDDLAISRLMQSIGRQYVRRFNFRYSRSGTLFDGRFKSSLVQEDAYLLMCMQYIELNPVRAGLVSDPGNYRWSSFRCHAYGKKAGLWSPHPTYKSLGNTPAKRQARYRRIIRDALTIDTLARIRHCANTGLVLGTDSFREQVEELTR